MYNERYKEDIHKRIKERRQALTMTQGELAEKINGGIGGAHTQISSWENQGKIPGTDSLIKLCDALDCDIDFLLGVQDEPRKATCDVMEQTGLSSEAVEFLMKLKRRSEDEKGKGLFAQSTRKLEVLSYILQNNSLDGVDLLSTLYDFLLGSYDQIIIDEKKEDGHIDAVRSNTVFLKDSTTGRIESVIPLRDLESVFLLNVQRYLSALRNKANRRRKPSVTVDLGED